MFRSPTPVATAASPWWALLVVPVGLIIGWLVVQLPSPKPQEPKSAVQQDGTTGPVAVSATVQSSPSKTSTSPGISERRPSNPPPARAERPAEGGPSGPYSPWTTLGNAIVESKRNGKPVMIDFSAEWCGPCRALKQQVFDDGVRGRAVQMAVIPVSIVDRAREDGSNPPEVENLQRQFQVNAFPTLVVFSPETGRATRTQGFGGADRTVAWITEAAKGMR